MSLQLLEDVGSAGEQNKVNASDHDAAPTRPGTANAAIGGGFSLGVGDATVVSTSSAPASEIDPARQASMTPSLRAATQTITDMTQVEWTEFKRYARTLEYAWC